METIPHGGRVREARRLHPGAPEPFIDLSTGINPEAYPFDAPGAEAWRRLPEPEEVAALEAVAACAYGAVHPGMVVAAPGTQALIQMLPRVLPQGRIAIPGPTYGEHAACWGGAVVDEESSDGGQAMVLCNPNNPDGMRHDPVGLARHKRDLLVVDEAFADFEPGLSLVPLMPVANTVVLRSFGKAYGLAGLRLGFAVAAPAVAARMRAALGPWAVSGPSIAIGVQALGDAGWREAAAARAAAAAGRLDVLLAGHGLEVLGGTSLFRLVRVDGAPALFRHLAEAGVLVRAFEALPGRLRFGLPGDEAAWGRLDAALGRWVRSLG